MSAVSTDELEFALMLARQRVLKIQTKLHQWTISYLFHKHKQAYSSPRITADLRARGWRVSPNTVAELMREQRLVVVSPSRRPTLPNSTLLHTPRYGSARSSVAHILEDSGGSVLAFGAAEAHLVETARATAGRFTLFRAIPSLPPFLLMKTARSKSSCFEPTGGQPCLIISPSWCCALQR